MIVTNGKNYHGKLSFESKNYQILLTSLRRTLYVPVRMCGFRRK